MKTLILKRVYTDVLDASDVGHFARVPGNTEFLIQRWNDPEDKNFQNTSEIVVKLSALPEDLSRQWMAFCENLYTWIDS